MSIKLVAQVVQSKLIVCKNNQPTNKNNKNPNQMPPKTNQPTDHKKMKQKMKQTQVEYMERIVLFWLFFSRTAPVYALPCCMFTRDGLLCSSECLLSTQPCCGGMQMKGIH